MSGLTNKVENVARFFSAIAGIALISNASSPLSAAPKSKQDRTVPAMACSFSPVTWVRDDRLPPVIRSAPSFAAPIIGRMAHKRLPDGDGPRGVDIKVTALSGDWVQVEATKADPEHGALATPAGWLEVHDIYFVMQTSVGFSRPDAKSRHIYATDDWIYRKAILNIRDCREGWLKLTINGDAEEREGEKSNIVTAWFRGFCGIEETTCEGVGHE